MNLLKFIVVGCLSVISTSALSQTRQLKPHYVSKSDLRIVCTCNNILVSRKYSGTTHTHRGVFCVKYNVEPCSNCKKVWIEHAVEPNDKGVKCDFELMPRIVSKEDVEHLRPIKGSCYVVDSIPVEGTNKYRYTIRAKDCDKPMWCLPKGELSKPQEFGRGRTISYESVPGKSRRFYITHVRPSNQN